MDKVVSYGDVVVRGPVTDYQWRRAWRAGVLQPIKTAFAYKRRKFMASDVELVFGLPAGCLGGDQSMNKQQERG